MSSFQFMPIIISILFLFVNSKLIAVCITILI